MANSIIEELMNQLTEISEEGTGFHTTAWSSQFIATEEEPQFSGGIIGSHKPTTAPVLKQLVQYGVKALPGLISHLPDARETQLVICGRDFRTGWRCFSDEYDPRFQDPAKQPKGVNSTRGGKGWHERSFESYTLRVGDLCYVVIGQIVNRRLLSVRYQPTGGQIVNSPIQTPALVQAVVDDWSGIDEVEHQNSLVRDSFYDDWSVSADAVSRLLYYYPDVGEEIAIRLLNRQICDHLTVLNFVDYELNTTDDPEVWKTKIHGFAEEYGDSIANCIPSVLHSRYIRHPREEDLSRIPIAEQIFSELYPEIDRFYPTEFVNAASIHVQIRLGRRIRSHCPDSVLDAIESLFLRTTNARMTIDSEGEHWQFYGMDELVGESGGLCWYDDLALSCMTVLDDRGLSRVFSDYCRQRIQSIEGGKAYKPETYRLDELREALADFSSSN